MLSKIKAFVVVAENLSFTEAARRLNTSQPWLSVQIKQLEEHFRFKLLNRTKRSVELTPEGRAVLAIATRISENYGELLEAVQIVRKGMEEDLTLGFQSSTIYDPMRIFAVSQFMNQNPRISLTVRNRSFDTISLDGSLQDLQQGRLDFLFAPLPYVPSSSLPSEFEAITLSHREVVLLLPANHPLASHEFVPNYLLNGCKVLTGRSKYMDNFALGGTVPEIDWIVPPEIGYESRMLMIKMFGMPSLWGYPSNRDCPLLDGLTMRHLQQPLYCDYGFVRTKQNNKPSVRKFLNFIERTASLSH